MPARPGQAALQEHTQDRKGWQSTPCPALCRVLLCYGYRVLLGLVGVDPASRSSLGLETLHSGQFLGMSLPVIGPMP